MTFFECPQQAHHHELGILARCLAHAFVSPDIGVILLLQQVLDGYALADVFSLWQDLPTSLSCQQFLTVTITNTAHFEPYSFSWKSQNSTTAFETSAVRIICTRLEIVIYTRLTIEY